MRILDANDNPIANPDEDLGRLVSERILIAEGRPYRPAKTERITSWTDGENSLYENVTVEPEQPAVPPVYETIQRYIPYTAEELAQRAAEKEAAEQAQLEAEAEAARKAELQKQIESLPEQVDDLNEAVAEVGVMVADGETTTNDLYEAIAELGVRVEEIAARKE